MENSSGFELVVLGVLDIPMPCQKQMMKDKSNIPVIT